MIDSMRRIVILALAVLALLLVALELAVPPLAERRVEGRLTEHGGSARVDLSAFPSPRLLFREGDRVRVRASGIATPPIDPARPSTLGELDGFDEVDVRATDMRAGPFRVALLTLERGDGESAYRATVRATVTGAALSAFAGRQLGGGIGGFLGGIAGGAMPGARAEIPIDLRAVLRSDGGRARAVTVDGSVAGLPAGPLVELLTTALAGRF
jgi:hypothetical protein